MNTLTNRNVLKNHQRIKHNKFQNRKRFESEPIKEIKFKNYYSKNLKEYNFTNFLKENGDFNKKEILKEINLNNNIKYLEKKFELKELHESKAKTDRVLNIINSYSNTNVDDICKIKKYKNISDKEIQLYIIKNDNDYEVILIDIYHLGIPSEKHKLPNGITIKSRNDVKYNKFKENCYNISNIITNLSEKSLIEKYSYKEPVAE